jgi:hypothetical protein
VRAQAGREYRTVTERVGVADLSSFGKFRVEGSGARQLLDLAVAGTVPRVGRTTLVHMLTPSGRVYAELTLTCTEEDRYIFFFYGRYLYGHHLYMITFYKAVFCIVISRMVHFFSGSFSYGSFFKRFTFIWLFFAVIFYGSSLFDYFLYNLNCSN